MQSSCPSQSCFCPIFWHVPGHLHRNVLCRITLASDVLLLRSSITTLMSYSLHRRSTKGGPSSDSSFIFSMLLWQGFEDNFELGFTAVFVVFWSFDSNISLLSDILSGASAFLVALCLIWIWWGRVHFSWSPWFLITSSNSTVSFISSMSSYS